MRERAIFADTDALFSHPELYNAAYLSAWKNQPVALPIDAAEYDTCLAFKCREEEQKDK